MGGLPTGALMACFSMLSSSAKADDPVRRTFSIHR
jgi:hypothetical protein